MKSSSSNNVPSEKSENEEQALTKQTGTPNAGTLPRLLNSGHSYPHPPKINFLLRVITLKKWASWYAI
ncbi:hypothetical protein Golomagni_01343 [Golovinomyces magnicellulatus]|nr:hypothetical protein Golomagni_01343 [Golovinomyces magnicellulatus]